MINSIARLTTRITTVPFARAFSSAAPKVNPSTARVKAVAVKFLSPGFRAELKPFNEFIANNPEVFKECGGDVSKMVEVFDAYSKMSANHEASVAKGHNPSTIL